MKKTEYQKLKEDYPEAYKKTLVYSVEELIDSMKDVFKQTIFYRFSVYIVDKLALYFNNKK